MLLPAAPAVLLGLLLAACDAGARAPATPTAVPHTPTVPPATTPVAAAPASPVHGARNLAMGIGEPRIPEPFTIEQRLLDAVRRGDRRTIERALERGAPITATDDIRRGVVLLAVLDAGDLELARWLRARGAAVDDPDSGGRTALSFAAEAGRLDLVEFLVAEGAQVDRPDVQQRTPLHHAALGNHTEVIAFLLTRGAAVDARDQFGDTPLIVACAKGNAAAAQLLLDRGADAAIRDQEGRTASERAAPEAVPCR